MVPDLLAVEQGSKYFSREMREKLAASRVSIEKAPIESPGSIGTVERYYARLRCPYQKIREMLRK